MKFKPLWAVYRTLPNYKHAWFWREAYNKREATSLCKTYSEYEQGTFFVVKLVAQKEVR